MSDVFISHSSKDKDIADGIVEFLEAKGISCWIAPRNIVAGSDWAAAISTAITASKVFLLVYSENSSGSDQCAREISLAESEKGITIIPYKTDDAELTGTYKYYLTGAHWITANYKNKEHRYDELYSFIAGALGKNAQTINAQTYINDLHIHQDGTLYSPPPVTKKEGKKANIPLIAVSAAAVIAVIALVFALMSNSSAPAVSAPVSEASAQQKLYTPKIIGGTEGKEGYGLEKLVDNDDNSTWRASQTEETKVLFETDSSVKTEAICLTMANDAQYAPKTVVIFAGEESSVYTLFSTVVEPFSINEGSLAKYTTIHLAEEIQGFPYYMLKITSTYGSDTVELAEIKYKGS